MIIRKILLVILLILCLVIYTLFIKKEKITPQDIQNIEKTVDEIPQIEKDKPKIDLKYNEVFLEKNYKEIYPKEGNKALEQMIPSLSEENTEKQKDFDIHVKPEINFDKTTKEITIDGVQIQMEKKF